MLLRVEGIVIRSMDYGEGNKIIGLYTKQQGKISVMARGAKKLKSRHGAVTQLFTYGDYTVFKSGSMGTLSQGEPIESHQKLREDLNAAAYSSYLAELCDKLTSEGEADPMLFEQLIAAFRGIEEGKDPWIILSIVEMKLLALNGYLPELDECVSCGESGGSMAFSPAQGGLLCAKPTCRAKDPSAAVLLDPVLRLLRMFRQVDLRRLGATDVKDATREQIRGCMRSFMDAHLDIRWKSRAFLDQMIKYGL